MNENLNLVEILKDCPNGTKLYSSVFGEVELDLVDVCSKYPIVIRLKDEGRKCKCLTTEGKLFLEFEGECILFPSRENRDWSKFKHTCEFKDGDILSYQCACFKNRTIYIYRYRERFNTGYYVALSGDNDKGLMIDNKGVWALNGYNETVRFATEEEKQKLFQAIKDNRYKWNAETKTLEKLVEPRFKVGDWVVFITSKSVYKVEKKENYEYTLRHILGGSMCLPFSNEKLIREWTIEDAKDGDVLVNGSNIFIFHFINNIRLMGYCHVNMNNGNFYNDIGRNECFCTIDAPVTPATKEQRDALMKAMNDNGYELDDETKTLKKLVKHKFDPSTLKPFDRVLVKFGSCWRIELFSHMYEYKGDIYYACAMSSYKECIPYNGETKHLVNTSEEAPEYYRYWED